MARQLSVFSTLLIALLLSACNTMSIYRNKVASWQGANAKQLIRVWGEPDSKIKTTLGNDIYIYQRDRTWMNVPAYFPGDQFINHVNGFAYTGYFPDYYDPPFPRLYHCVVEFEIDNTRQLVSNTSVRGNDCLTP